MSSKDLSKNQKRPEFFCFFALFQVRVPSKNQKKNLEFFSFFQGHDQKKTRGKPKKNKHEPQTKHSLKIFVFFGFMEVFCFLVFPIASLLKRSQIADSSL